MATNKIGLKEINAVLEGIKSSLNLCDPDVLQVVLDHISEKNEGIKAETVNWNDFLSFWPPRLIKAYRNNNCSCFFGAGLSIPSNLPNWNNLLTDYFKIEEHFTSDNDLKHDPLTVAEIAKNYIGSDSLQSILRKEFSRPVQSATSHYIVSSLRCQIYITTNYDDLFEKAWKIINPDIELVTITNDLDLRDEFDESHISEPLPTRAYLFKIHGSVDRRNEKLILTRTDYRNHYRSNTELFRCLKNILRKHHILFMGFSHNDADITRIVEDAIHEYEVAVQENNTSPQPNFYSLQFDMASYTPEVFAAKGIVALEPPITSFSGDIRSKGLNVALAEFQLLSHYKLDRKVSLENQLDQFKTEVESNLKRGLKKLEDRKEEAIFSVRNKKSYAWLNELIKSLGGLASEGVYLTDDQGEILDHATPYYYDKKEREIEFSLQDRPYFRQAKTFRKPFVSDAIESKFNGNSTIFLCYPIIKDSKFLGLLFSAFQLGKWAVPKTESLEVWKQDCSVILIDSNGICLMPPNNEIQDDDFGYKHEKLVSMSIRDRLIMRLNENVVPISKDDEVVSLSPNLKVYCLISELVHCNWKIGIAKSIFLNK